MLSANSARGRKEKQHFADSKLGGIGEPDHEASLRSCIDMKKVCIGEGRVQSLFICLEIVWNASNVNRVSGRIVYVYKVSDPMRTSRSFIRRSNSVPHYPTCDHILTSSIIMRLIVPSTLSRKISNLFCGASPFHPDEVSNRGNPICSTMNEDDTVAYNAATHQLCAINLGRLTFIRITS
jgi:hypothetical protein